MTVRYEPDGQVVVVTIDRPEVRNAVDPATAGLLVDGFERFAADEELAVAVLTGAGGNFSSGFDLKALARGKGNRLDESGPGPMGPTRMTLDKPVIAAIEGYAVAGGSSWRSGATSGWRRATRPSASIAAASACR